MLFLQSTGRIEERKQLVSRIGKFVLELYLLYAKLEEEYGLPRHAMNIYNRATTAVEKNEMYSVCSVFIWLFKIISCWKFRIKIHLFADV